MNNFRDTLFQQAMESALARCAKDPSLVIVYDEESGFPEVWTTENVEKRLAIMEEVMPKLDKKWPRNITIFGTGNAC